MSLACSGKKNYHEQPPRVVYRQQQQQSFGLEGWNFDRPPVLFYCLFGTLK